MKANKLLFLLLVLGLVVAATTVTYKTNKSGLQLSSVQAEDDTSDEPEGEEPWPYPDDDGSQDEEPTPEPEE